MFGNLIEELQYWHLSVDDEDEEGDLEYCEQKFLETLRAIRDLREALLDDLNVYIEKCKADNEPIDLAYYRIKKQLDESTFDLIRSQH
jgi:hypothetical protein